MDEEVKEAFDVARRASIIASSNINPSDGDDEGKLLIFVFSKVLDLFRTKRSV